MDVLLHFNSFFWKKVEEVVRKNMLAELNRDRAEAKADRNDAKIQSEWNDFVDVLKWQPLIPCLMPGLEKELESVARNVSSLSKSGDEFAEQEVFFFILYFFSFSIFFILIRTRLQTRYPPWNKG